MRLKSQNSRMRFLSKQSSIAKSRSLNVLVILLKVFVIDLLLPQGEHQPKLSQKSAMDLNQACSICATSGSSGDGRVRATRRSSFLILTAGNGTFLPVMRPVISSFLTKVCKIL